MAVIGKINQRLQYAVNWEPGTPRESINSDSHAIGIINPETISNTFATNNTIIKASRILTEICCFWKNVIFETKITSPPIKPNKTVNCSNSDRIFLKDVNGKFGFEGW